MIVRDRNRPIRPRAADADSRRNDEASGDPPICPICSTVGAPVLEVPGDWRRPSLSSAYRIVRCPSCGHGTLDPMPTLRERIEAHDLPSYCTHGGGATGEARGALSRLDQKLRDHIAFRMDRGGDTQDNVVELLARLGERPRICEIGCGHGSLGARLVGEGHQYVGIEVDATARAIAEEQGLHVVEGMAESVPEALQGERFDVVLMIHVLEHIEDVNAALRTVRALLHPGGLFICEVPNNAALGFEMGGALWPWLDVPRHVHFFVEWSMRRLVYAHDLTIEDIRYTGFCRQFSAPWLAEEERIRASFASRGRELRTRGRLGAWSLLARSALAPDERRYDSFMVLARS